MLEKHVNNDLSRINFENVLSYKTKSYSKVVNNRITAERMNEFIYFYSSNWKKSTL